MRHDAAAIEALGHREPRPSSTLADLVGEALDETQAAFSSRVHASMCVDSWAGGDALVYGFRGRPQRTDECVRGPFGKAVWLPHLRSVHSAALKVEIEEGGEDGEEGEGGDGGEEGEEGIRDSPLGVVRAWGPLCQRMGAAMCKVEPVAYLEQHLRMGGCDDVLVGATCFPPRTLQVRSEHEAFLATPQLVIRERGVLASDAELLAVDDKLADELLLQFCSAHSDHADVDEVEVIAYFTCVDHVVEGGLGKMYIKREVEQGGRRLCLRLALRGGRSSSSGATRRRRHGRRR